MSRSFHSPRKSALKAFNNGDLEPIKEYSLKSETKKLVRKVKKGGSYLKNITESPSKEKNEKAFPKFRNSIVVSYLKRERSL